MRTTINLLPVSYQRQQLVRRRVIQWCSIILAVLVVGSAWHWYESREYTLLAQQLEVLSREHAPTQTMLKQLVDMRQQLDELQQQETVAKELEHQRSTLALLGAISKTAEKTKGRLRVAKLELTDFQQLRSAGASAPAGATPTGLLLTGVSLDNKAVSELLDGLQDSGMFSRVALLKCMERENNADSLRDYEVRCEF
jgi:Tfp pilus assembly protein PilN